MGMNETQRVKALQQIKQLPRAQQLRLLYIDFKLYFLGELRRSDVTDRFETAPAGATRDIAQYREVAPKNLRLDASTKIYHPTESFVPLFEHQPYGVLNTLSQGFGEGMGAQPTPMVRSEVPMPLSLPKLSVLAPITRSLNLRNAIRIRYLSVESGASEREIVPLALVHNSVRWHVRAYDRKNRDFRDFVLTRIDEAIELQNKNISIEETLEADVQWSRIIELELVPHPDHPQPKAVLMDYDMPDDVLRVKVRAVHVGYLMRLWSVDCSPNHSLNGKAYALWLRDPLALYGVSNARLAPGYVDPRNPGPGSHLDSVIGKMTAS